MTDLVPQTGQSASDRPNSNINITSGGNEKTKIILATAGYDHTIRFWEALDGDCLGIIQHNESQVICMEGSQCKRFLAVGGHMSIRIYDLSKTFDEINELNLKKLSKIVKSQTTSISTVIPRVAAVPITKSVTNKQEMNNVNYETNFPDVNISNEELATTFKQKNAPMAHGSLIETLFTGYGNTVSLGFLHIDGQLIIWSVNEDGSIKMWKEENTFKCIKEFNLPLDGENHDKGHRNTRLNCASVSGLHSLIVIGDSNGIISLFDFKNETILYRISSMSLINGTPPVTTVYPLSTPLIPPISKVSISSDNLLAAAVDEGGLIHVWPLCMDPKKSKIFTHLVHPGFRVLHCIFSPSSKHTTQHLDVSSMLDCSGVLEKKGMESDQNDAILSRQKNCYQIVTCGSDCISRLWTITTESNENMEGSIIKLDLEFKGHDRWIWDATFTADGGYMLTASSDGCAKLWCTSGDTINDAVCTFKGHQKGLTSIFLNDFP